MWKTQSEMYWTFGWKGRKLMDLWPARNAVTFILYNPACSFHCKILSHNGDNMLIALLTVCAPVHWHNGYSLVTSGEYKYGGGI